METTANYHACASSRTVTCFLVFLRSVTDSALSLLSFASVCFTVQRLYGSCTLPKEHQGSPPALWAVKLSPFAVTLAVNGRQQQSGEFHNTRATFWAVKLSLFAVTLAVNRRQQQSGSRAWSGSTPPHSSLDPPVWRAFGRTPPHSSLDPPVWGAFGRTPPHSSLDPPVWGAFGKTPPGFTKSGKVQVQDQSTSPSRLENTCAHHTSREQTHDWV